MIQKLPPLLWNKNISNNKDLLQKKGISSNWQLQNWPFISWNPYLDNLKSLNNNLDIKQEEFSKQELENLPVFDIQPVTNSQNNEIKQESEQKQRINNFFIERWLDPKNKPDLNFTEKDDRFAEILMSENWFSEEQAITEIILYKLKQLEKEGKLISENNEIKQESEPLNKSKANLSIWSFIEHWLKPSFQNTIIDPVKWIWDFVWWSVNNIKDNFVWWIERIWNAGEWIADWTYDPIEWLMRWAQWALNSATAIATWPVQKWVETIIKNTPDQIKETIGDIASPIVNNVTDFYNNRTKNDKRFISNLWVLWDIWLNVAWIKLSPKAISKGKNIIKKVDSKIVNTTKPILDKTKPIVDKALPLPIKNKIEDIKIKNTNKKQELILKNKEEALNQLNNTTWRVIQWKIDDIKPAVESFKILDTKWVNNYKDLDIKIKTKEKDIIKLQDKLLQNDKRNYGLNNTKQTIKTPMWDKNINYIENAINDIKREIDNAWSFTDYNNKMFDKNTSLWEVIKKVENWKATLEDLNDLARYYNSQFKKKIYTKKWDPKDTILAEKYETNRTWLKEFIRKELPTNELKNLDLQYSNLADTQKLVWNMVEAITKLEQKLRKRWPVEKLWYIAWTAADKITGWGLKWVISSLTPSNMWNKINNVIDINNELSKNLKKINKLLNKDVITIKDLQPFKTTIKAFDKVNKKIPKVLKEKQNYLRIGTWVNNKDD